MLEKRIEAIWLEELEYICQKAEAADEGICGRCIEEINRHKAPEDFKPPFLQRIQKRIQTIWSEELAEICRDLEAADEESCRQRIEAVNRHKAPDNLKTPYTQRIEKRIQNIWTDELSNLCKDYETADETTCETMVTAVKEHKAPDSLKAPFLQRLQSRIESIWSAEDGEIFDNLYIKTDITNPQAVAEAVAYVQSKGRTVSSAKYLAALNACTLKNIENARLYKNTKRFKLYILLAVLSLLGCVVSPYLWLLAVPFFYLAWKMKKAWNILTIKGTVIPPALLDLAQPKSKT